MRILTVRQPWAWAIIHGGKDVENRSRNVAGGYRGPVAIHGGLRDDDDAPPELFYERAKWFWDRGTPYPGSLPDTQAGRGAIIGVVDLVDVHRDDTEPCNGRLRLGICSRWADPNSYHLVLANQRPLSEPIPYRGALGLRTLDAEIQARILAAIA